MCIVRTCLVRTQWCKILRRTLKFTRESRPDEEGKHVWCYFYHRQGIDRGSSRKSLQAWDYVLAEAVAAVACLAVAIILTATSSDKNPSAAGSLSTHLNSRLAAVKAPSNQAARQDFLYRPAGSFLYSIPIGCYATLRSGFSDFLTQKFTPLSMYRYKTNAHNTVPGMHTIQSQTPSAHNTVPGIPSCPLVRSNVCIVCTSFPCCHSHT